MMRARMLAASCVLLAACAGITSYERGRELMMAGDVEGGLTKLKEAAEAYNRTGYAEVLKAMSDVVEGTPRVQTFEVAFSTLHKAAAKTA